jgi:hypothetical protein
VNGDLGGRAELTESTEEAAYSELALNVDVGVCSDDPESAAVFSRSVDAVSDELGGKPELGDASDEA